MPDLSGKKGSAEGVVTADRGNDLENVEMYAVKASINDSEPLERLLFSTLTDGDKVVIRHLADRAGGYGVAQIRIDWLNHVTTGSASKRITRWLQDKYGRVGAEEGGGKMNMRILCFGDSNTYGYDPRDVLERRYPPQERWPELLAAATGWDVVNLGLNGRTIPHRPRETECALAQIRSRLPADCLVVLLGSNDALLMDDASAEMIGARMDGFLRALRKALPDLPILLLSPPRVEIPLAHIQELIWDLIPVYRKLAAKHHAFFASPPAWQLPLSADEVHFSAEAHQIFAGKAETLLRQILSPQPGESGNPADIRTFE